MASFFKRLIALLLLVTFTAAFNPSNDSPFDLGHLEARQSDPIAAALAHENTDLQAFQKYLSSLPSSGPITASQAAQLQKYFNAAYNDIKKATSACQSSRIPSPKQCKVYLNILTQLYNLLQTVLNNIVAHQAAFAAGGYTGVICNDLKQAAAAFAALFQCLEKQCCQAIPQCPFVSLAAKYAAAFQAAENSLGC